MGRRLLVVVLVLLIPAAFVLGRETSSNTTQAPPTALGTSKPVLGYTIREDDTVRVPAAATRCQASQEGGIPNFGCSRYPGGRYQVVFSEETVYVYRVGDPDNPHVFRWAP
jgi:hypothetical protein